jgi:hypothetical protein
VYVQFESTSSLEVGFSRGPTATVGTVTNDT